MKKIIFILKLKKNFICKFIKFKVLKTYFINYLYILIFYHYLFINNIKNNLNQTFNNNLSF